jgi:LysR family transcriptional activator of nhaA
LEPTDLGRLIFRYADDIFSLGREMMDTIRGRVKKGASSALKAGIVNVLPKLIVLQVAGAGIAAFQSEFI